MDARNLRHIALVLLLTAGLGGCAVYGAPYAAYADGYPAYAYPSYVGPPLMLDFGFGYYGGRSHHHHGRHHGWGGNRGWSGHGGGHHRGGWERGRGRH